MARTVITAAKRAAALPADAWLAAIVASSDDAIVSKTLDGRITSWNGAAERLFGYTAEEAIGQPIAILAAPDREDEMPNILARIRRGEPVNHYDTVRRRKDGGLVNISLGVSPIRNAAGTLVGASKIARDISERKEWERRQKLLLHELNHRVRNMLAVIQSIARQTGQHAGSMEQFLGEFNGRLAALAAGHDLLVASQWRSAALDEVARGTLGLHAGEEGDRLCLALPAVRLHPSLALNLALALHELASNAAKFGALSAPSGRIELVGRLGAGDLGLVWREDGGPPVQPPAHGGFGTTLLTEIFAQHGGQVDFDWRREGLVCSIQVRLMTPEP